MKSKTISVKYVDDGTTASSINLKESLVRDPKSRQRPLTYLEKNELILQDENNPAQMSFDEIEKFARDNKMVVNKSKTKVIVFNLSKNLQFPPEIKHSDGNTFLEVVSETKLLGVVISNDLKWHRNTNSMIQKARKRIWILRRLKKLQFDRDFLLEIYTKEIRPLLEFAAPVWSSSLTANESTKVQSTKRSVQVNLTKLSEL